ALVPQLSKGRGIVEGLPDAAPELLRVDDADADPAAGRRVRARPRVADGGEARHARPLAVDEAAIPVEDARHRQDAGDRLAVEPVRLKWTRPNDGVEAVVEAELLQRRVAHHR